MELNVNSPAYFKEQYGVDDVVYRFCQKAYLFFRDREYSDTLHIIGIVPVVAPQELYDRGAWKENIRFLDNKSVVSVVIRMDFENYYHADSMGKLVQTKEMVLTAMKRIRAKGKFDYEKFKEDFLSLV
ncbi:MAG: hypothetical protein K2N80_16340 [Lachnospiraceae bacterium]|nr:hypothetical protein [Lachnospiraceae bacterium]